MSGLQSPNRKPICAGLSLAVPTLGILLTFGLAHLPGVLGRGDFATFAPVIAVCLVALPLGLIGLALAVAALFRREKWMSVGVVGVVLNLAVLSMFVVFILDL
jgi:hypothetical protein